MSFVVIEPGSVMEPVDVGDFLDWEHDQWRSRWLERKKKRDENGVPPDSELPSVDRLGPEPPEKEPLADVFRGIKLQIKLMSYKDRVKANDAINKEKDFETKVDLTSDFISKTVVGVSGCATPQGDPVSFVLTEKKDMEKLWSAGLGEVFYRVANSMQTLTYEEKKALRSSQA